MPEAAEDRIALDQCAVELRPDNANAPQSMLLRRRVEIAEFSMPASVDYPTLPKSVRNNWRGAFSLDQ